MAGIKLFRSTEPSHKNKTAGMAYQAMPAPAMHHLIILNRGCPDTSIKIVVDTQGGADAVDQDIYVIVAVIGPPVPDIKIEPELGHLAEPELRPHKDAIHGDTVIEEFSVGANGHRPCRVLKHRISFDRTSLSVTEDALTRATANSTDSFTTKFRFQFDEGNLTIL